MTVKRVHFHRNEIVDFKDDKWTYTVKGIGPNVVEWNIKGSKTNVTVKYVSPTKEEDKESLIATKDDEKNKADR